MIRTNCIPSGRSCWKFNWRNNFEYTNSIYVWINEQIWTETNSKWELARGKIQMEINTFSRGVKNCYVCLLLRNFWRIMSYLCYLKSYCWRMRLLSTCTDAMNWLVHLIKIGLRARASIYTVHHIPFSPVHLECHRTVTQKLNRLSFCIAYSYRFSCILVVTRRII